MGVEVSKMDWVKSFRCRERTCEEKEIDEKIAKLLGWKELPKNEWSLGPETQKTLPCTIKTWKKPNGYYSHDTGDGPRGLPLYHRQIDWAIELFREMNGFSIINNKDATAKLGGDKEVCGYFLVTDNLAISETDKKIEIAICKAWIKWKESLIKK